MKWRLGTLVGCLLIAVQAVQADVAQAWLSRLNLTNEAELAYWMALDSRGNVVTAGLTNGFPGSDYVVAKHDPAGNLLWHREFNGSANWTDYTYGLAVDSSDNVIVTGFSYTPTNSYDYVTIKYDPNGNQLWMRQFDHNAGYDTAYALTTDRNNNVIVSGGDYNTHDWITIKYDPAGNTLWTKITPNGTGYVLKTDTAGNIYDFGELNGDYCLIKRDPNGNVIFQSTWDMSGHGEDLIYAAKVDSAGNAYATGYGLGAHDVDIGTIKWNPDGSRAWAAEYAGSGNASDWAGAIDVDSTGHAYVAGWISAYPYLSDSSIGTLKYGPTGTLEWAQAVSNRYFSGENSAYGISLDSAGNAVVAGALYDGPVHGYDGIILKYDPAGNELFRTLYDGPNNGEDHWDSVLVGPSDAIYVCGQSVGVGTGPDYVVARYQQGQSVAPTTFSIFRGTLDSGGLNELLVSDDQYLVIRNGVTALRTESPITVRFSTTSPTQTANMVQCTIENHVSISGLTQRIDMFDYTTSAYVQLDVRSAAQSDQVVTVTAPSANAVIAAGSKEMKSQLRIRADGPVFTNTWRSYADLVSWFVG